MVKAIKVMLIPNNVQKTRIDVYKRQEIYIRIHSAKTCEKFRKEIRRRNGGGCQINDLLSGTGEIFQKIVADIQNAESAVVELVYHTFL